MTSEIGPTTTQDNNNNNKQSNQELIVKLDIKEF